MLGVIFKKNWIFVFVLSHNQTTSSRSTYHLIWIVFRFCRLVCKLRMLNTQLFITKPATSILLVGLASADWLANQQTWNRNRKTSTICCFSPTRQSRTYLLLDEGFWCSQNLRFPNPFADRFQADWLTGPSTKVLSTHILNNKDRTRPDKSKLPTHFFGLLQVTGPGSGIQLG